MTSNIQQSAIRALVVVLVLSLVAQSAVAPAMASTTTSPDGPTVDCSENGGLWWLLGPAAGVAASSECQQARESFDNITNHNIYASATSLADLEETAVVQNQNMVSHSEAYAWTIVKNETIYGLRNNLTKSEVKDNINASLGGYYSAVQRNLVVAHNSNQNQHRYLANSTTEDYRFARERKRPNSGDRFSYDGSEIAPLQEDGTSEWWFKQLNVSLINGTTMNYTTSARARVDQSPTQLLEYYDPFTIKAYTYWNDTSYYAYENVNNGTAVLAQHPDSSANPNNGAGDYITSYTEGEFSQAWNKTVDSHDRIQSNAMGYVDDVYANYSAEDFDGIELLDAITLATQYSSEYNSTGYYAWQSAEAATLGIDTNVNSSWTIAYTPAANSSYRNASFVVGETYTLSGALYTDWKPAQTNGSFVNGTTYNTSNADSPVYFAYQPENGSAETVVLEGEFTVEGLTNARTGESVNETSLEDHNVQTANASATYEQILQLMEHRANVSATHDPDTSTTNGWDFGSVSPFGAGVAALGALLLIAFLGSNLG